jgi:hypothetical protein
MAPNEVYIDNERRPAARMWRSSGLGFPARIVAFLDKLERKMDWVWFWNY